MAKISLVKVQTVINFKKHTYNVQTTLYST